MPTAFVYILRCSDHTLYVGHTTDVWSRERTHNEGRGGSYTAQRRPVTVVYSEPYDSIDGAIKRERQIKGWTSKKKHALIAGDVASLKRLSQRRRPKRTKT